MKNSVTKKKFVYFLTAICVGVLLILCHYCYSMVSTTTLSAFLPPSYPEQVDTRRGFPGKYDEQITVAESTERLYELLLQTEVRKRFVPQNYGFSYHRYYFVFFTEDLSEFQVVYYPDIAFVEIYDDLERIAAAQVVPGQELEAHFPPFR